MVWGRVSAYGIVSFHIWKGTISAIKVLKVLEEHVLPSR